MVIEHAGNDVLELLHIAEDARADFRMLFHLVKLFRSQLAGFLEHRLGHADFSHVVQQPGHVNSIDLIVGTPRKAGQMPAEQRHALAVAARVSILGVNRAGETVQQAHHQAVHVAEQNRVLQING